MLHKVSVQTMRGELVLAERTREETAIITWKLWLEEPRSCKVGLTKLHQ